MCERHIVIAQPRSQSEPDERRTRLPSVDASSGAIHVFFAHWLRANVLVIDEVQPEGRRAMKAS
jgi:hypothetical protein